MEAKREWLTEEFLLNLHIMGPFEIYSDGSWASKGDPWKQIMGNLPEFSRTVDLTFLSSLDDWRERPVYTLQLVNGEGLIAQSAYTMELMGMFIALAILTHFQMSSKISSGWQ